MADEALIADVAIDCPGRDSYSYLVPEAHAELRSGDCVLVPFGRRRERGFVLAVERRAPPPGITLKELVERRVDVRLPPHLLRLIRWGARYYRCSLGEFLSGAVPASVREGAAPQRERLVVRIADFDGRLSKRQREVWEALDSEAERITALCRRLSCSPGLLERLATIGAVELRDEQEIRELQLDAVREVHEPNDEQTAVIDAVGSAMAADRHEVFLLYGVTGSGKTLVYMELVERAIAAGQQVLVLLPEIALTPQLAARFRARFGRVAVWHSGFTAGERAEQWRRVAAGEVDLVVGARSALFAPVPSPGLIIVDEEHDSSFKQDSVPRYQARDLAVVYGSQLGVPVLLGTATPSLESYHNAQQGRYRVLALRQRPTGGRLPQAELIDMAEEGRRQKRRALLSEALVGGLEKVREQGDQAIVLLNRRGWSPVVSCLGCGHVLGCRHCDISLTFHRAADRLRCHYCGHMETMPSRCPACEQPDLSSKGMGTEQLAALLAERVPSLRILRVDADTVAGRQGHARLFHEFARGAADCLVGTQMVAKGLDFPRVTLVGIVGADMGLAIPDFRASERTYQLVAQVSGRAGRGTRAGRVVVQAFDSEALPIRCALEQRARSFYEHELNLRREYGYPPGAGLVRFLWRGEEQDKVRAVAERQGERIRSAAGDLPVLGPTPAGLSYLKGQFRWHALVKGGSRGVIQRFLDRLQELGALRAQRGVKVAVDVDPYAIT